MYRKDRMCKCFHRGTAGGKGVREDEGRERGEKMEYQERKMVPQDILERDEFFREKTNEVMNLLSQYELSALDYIKLIDFIKNQGLTQFKL